MKILLICPDFPPVLNSASRLFAELGESLCELGHEVTVLTRYGGRRKGSPKLRSKDLHGKVYVTRTRVLPVPNRIPLMRALEHVWMAISFLFAGLLLPRHDAVIVYSPPLPLGLTGWILARRWRGTLILNVQDLYPRTAIDLGLLRNKHLIRFSETLERFLYRKADDVTVHSDGNREHIIRTGVPIEKAHTIPNWVDLQLYQPGPRDNNWRSLNGLDNRFVVSFAGTMGFAQGVNNIIEAADLLKDRSEIVFVLAGDGVQHDTAQQASKTRKLPNLQFLPPQQGNAYLELLQASDICLVVLHKDLKTPVVPGKIQIIMASGRPVICVANPASDARHIIEESQCGYFVTAGDIDDLVNSILRLYNDREVADKLGKNGRRYSEIHFDRNQCTGAYDTILASLNRNEDPIKEAKTKDG